MAIYDRNEKDSANIGDTLCGMYFYYVDQDNIEDATYVGLTDRIQTITYNPFIKTSDITTLVRNNYSANGGLTPPIIPKCLRIESFDEVDKELSTFTKGDVMGNSYDPKCYTYPFSYIMLTDYINNPLLIKPQELGSNNIQVRVTTTPLSIESKYCIYVSGYKEDMLGNLEGIVNSFSFNLPVVSNAYSNFLATSGASFNQGNINAMLENDLTLKQGVNRNLLAIQQNKVNTGLSIASSVLSGVISGASGNVGGVANSILGGVSAGVNGYYNNLSLEMANTHLSETAGLKEQQITSMANAKVTDMINTPNSIKTSGSDPFFNMVKSRFKIDLIPYQCQRIDKINEQFKRYGYKINRWMMINKNSRMYYNYIKTNIPNIEGNGCSYEDLVEIKAIFNTGITFWHVDNGATVKNYNVDNVEVY